MPKRNSSHWCSMCDGRGCGDRRSQHIGLGKNMEESRRIGSNETLGRPAIAFLRSVFVATKRYNSGSGFNETFCPPGHMVPRSGKFKRIFPIPGHMRMGHKLWRHLWREYTSFICKLIWCESQGRRVLIHSYETCTELHTLNILCVYTYTHTYT